MFGIANQMLAVIGLCVVTSVMVNAGRGRYALLTILPMLFVATVTTTAGYQMSRGRFYDMVILGLKQGDRGLLIKGGLNIFLTLFMIGAVALIVLQALTGWLNHARRKELAGDVATEPPPVI
jgi:carbon starvation protein